MGVAVLSPENCLRDGFPHQNRHLISGPRSNTRRSPSTNRSGRRKPQSSPAGSPPSQSKGRVRILRRGEEFTTTKQPITKVMPVKNRNTKTDRLNIESAMFSTDPTPGPTTILSGFYAGSAFFTSPPPSSLPLPAFCAKNIGAGSRDWTKSSAEDATFGLRRILGLE